MVNMNDPFFLAARKKLRFSVGNSNVTVEQLFDLPLRSKSGKDLNTIFKRLARAVQEAKEFNLDGKADPHAKESIKLQVIRAVYTAKLQEEEAARIRTQRKALKGHQRNLALKELAKRDERNFASMSDAQLLSYL